MKNLPSSESDGELVAEVVFLVIAVLDGTTDDVIVEAVTGGGCVVKINVLSVSAFGARVERVLTSIGGGT